MLHIKTAQNFILPLLLTAAFTISLFFGGYQDLIYAPAVFALLTASLVALIVIKRPAVTFPVAPSALLLFTFGLYVTLSLSWSSVPFASLVTWLIFLSLPLTFLSLLTTANRDTAIKLTAAFIGTGLCILSAYALYQYITPGGGYEGRAHDPLPNPNSLGGLLAMAVPPLTALYLHSKGKMSYITLAATLLTFAGTLATGSRGAMIALVLALVVLFIALRGTSLSRAKLLPLILGAVVIFGAINMTAQKPITDRLAGLSHPTQEKEVVHRLALWKSSFEMVKDAPLLGRGLGTFYLTYPAYRDPVDRSMGNWAHMDSLQFAVEMGVMAPLLFYLFLGSVLFFTMRALKSKDLEPKERAIITGSFCGLLVIAIHCHATFHLYIMPILMTCGVLLALWYMALAKQQDEDASWLTLTLSGKRKAAFNLALIIAFLSVALVTASAAAGAYFTLKARDAISRNDVTAFANSIEKAQKYGPASFIDPNVQAAGFYADIAHTSLFLHSPEEQQDMVRSVETLLSAASYYNPHWAEIDYKRGVFYSKIDETIVPAARDIAVQSLVTALTKNPMHFRAREKLAEFYVSNGQVQKAYAIVQDGLKFPAPQYFYDKFYAMEQSLAPLAAIQNSYKTKPNTDEDTP